MVGRRPTPTELKLVTGNPGKRPLNDQEPKPEGEVKRPSFVKGRAARVWNQYAAGLIAAGVLTAWDVDMFGAWCCLMAEFQKDPDAFTASKISQMRALASSFGLTAADRSRIRVSPEKQSVDPAEKYFKRPG